MVQQLHDFHLPVDLLQVHSIQLGFVYDLNGHLQFNAEVSYSSLLISVRIKQLRLNH